MMLTIKDKLPQIRKWIRHNRIMLIVALVVTLLIYIDAQPPYPNFYKEEYRRIFFPPVMITTFIQEFAMEAVVVDMSSSGVVLLDTDWRYYFAILSIAVAIGGILGSSVQFLYRRVHRWINVVFLLILLSCNVVCGGLLLGSYSESCIQYFRNNLDVCQQTNVSLTVLPNGIHIRHVTHYLGKESNELFIFSSDDEGQTWHQFVNHRCSLCGGWRDVGYLDEQFFRIPVDDTLLYTHDGGQAWQLWEVNEQYYYPLIETVAFSDIENGIMTVSTYFGGTSRDIIYFRTTDGGETWQRFEND
jgi:hypothetical protein